MAKSVFLIVECPRYANLEHARIEWIASNREVLVVAEEVVVPVLIFQQDAHALPLCRNKGIEVWIVSDFSLVLVVEYR